MVLPVVCLVCPPLLFFRSWYCLDLKKRRTNKTNYRQYNDVKKRRTNKKNDRKYNDLKKRTNKTNDRQYNDLKKRRTTVVCLVCPLL
jgi:hypothetical protein